MLWFLNNQSAQANPGSTIGAAIYSTLGLEHFILVSSDHMSRCCQSMFLLARAKCSRPESNLLCLTFDNVALHSSCQARFQNKMPLQWWRGLRRGNSGNLGACLWWSGGGCGLSWIVETITQCRQKVLVHICQSWRIYSQNIGMSLWVYTWVDFTMLSSGLSNTESLIRIPLLRSPGTWLHVPHLRARTAI